MNKFPIHLTLLINVHERQLNFLPELRPSFPRALECFQDEPETEEKTGLLIAAVCN